MSVFHANICQLKGLAYCEKFKAPSFPPLYCHVSLFGPTPKSQQKTSVLNKFNPICCNTNSEQVTPFRFSRKEYKIESRSSPTLWYLKGIRYSRPNKVQSDLHSIDASRAHVGNMFLKMLSQPKKCKKSLK